MHRSGSKLSTSAGSAKINIQGFSIGRQARKIRERPRKALLKVNFLRCQLHAAYMHDMEVLRKDQGLN